MAQRCSTPSTQLKHVGYTYTDTKRSGLKITRVLIFMFQAIKANLEWELISPCPTALVSGVFQRTGEGPGPVPSSGHWWRGSKTSATTLTWGSNPHGSMLLKKTPWICKNPGLHTETGRELPGLSHAGERQANAKCSDKNCNMQIIFINYRQSAVLPLVPQFSSTSKIVFSSLSFSFHNYLFFLTIRYLQTIIQRTQERAMLNTGL